MGKMALGVAVAMAACLCTSPAVAGSPEESAGGGRSGFVVSNGYGHGHGHGGNGGGIWVNGGQWAQYNNQAFKSDSYNDWWHDRPDRAYPAWMRNNQNCARQWYAGSTLRC